MPLQPTYLMYVHIGESVNVRPIRMTIMLVSGIDSQSGQELFLKTSLTSFCLSHKHLHRHPCRLCTPRLTINETDFLSFRYSLKFSGTESVQEN